MRMHPPPPPPQRLPQPQESEYAAWVLAHGYALNHTTVSVHRMAGLQGGIAALNEHLQGQGFLLNAEGGVTKVCGCVWARARARACPRARAAPLLNHPLPPPTPAPYPHHPCTPPPPMHAGVARRPAASVLHHC